MSILANYWTRQRARIQTAVRIIRIRKNLTTNLRISRFVGLKTAEAAPGLQRKLWWYASSSIFPWWHSRSVTMKPLHSNDESVASTIGAERVEPEEGLVRTRELLALSISAELVGARFKRRDALFVDPCETLDWELFRYSAKPHGAFVRSGFINQSSEDQSMELSMPVELRQGWQKILDSAPRTAELFNASLEPAALQHLAPVLANLLDTRIECSDGELPAILSHESICDYLRDRSVALVANSSSLNGLGLGHKIDDSDVVIRFNSFIYGNPDFGYRLDVHAVFHGHPLNWDKKCHLRICTGPQAKVIDAYGRYLINSAQNGVGLTAPSNLWPITDQFRQGASLFTLQKSIDKLNFGQIPTLGFRFLLLSILANASEIKLFGFDGYASGSHRLAEATSIPQSAAHRPSEEIRFIHSLASFESEGVLVLRRQFHDWVLPHGS